jgi:prolyl oligopeptidase
VFSVVDQMPAQTVLDYENIIARLGALPTYIDQTIEEVQEHVDAGLTQPAFVVDLMLDQLAAQKKPAPFDSPLLAAFQRFPDSIPASTQRRLRANAAGAYTQQFVPAWTRLETYLRDRYRPKARTQAGLVGWKDGATAYARLIKHYTTTNASPEQVHQIGLREVDRLEQEMTAIARDYGFAGSLAAFQQELGNRPGMHFESQDEMLAYASDVLKAVQPTLPKLFLHEPRVAVGVRPIPPDREASQASNYVAGTADGSRQAWFNMNTYRPRDQVKYTVEALVLHETVPGHHLQVGLARELEGVPQFQRAFSASAFSEGWGLYAESLGTTLGVVYRDPPTRFGRLDSERFRAVRLVVDTGIHAMGWSRERAREYFTAHAPSQSLAEVDRYIARPAQALGYKLGQLKIVELRDRAQTALGPRFDLREFHDVVLRNGTIPLDLLEEQVDAYIAQARAR